MTKLQDKNNINKDIKKSIEEIRSEYAKKINELIIDSIQEEKRAYQEGLKLIAKKAPTSKKEKMIWTVSGFLWSWRYILIILSMNALWAMASIVPQLKSFDPYPFSGLSFALGIVALIQSALIMYSQNRTKIADEERQQNDYLVNLKNEVEINSLHKKVDLVIYDQIQTLIETQKIQFEYLDDIQAKLWWNKTLI